MAFRPPPLLHDSLKRLLVERGFTPSRIVRVDSPGDAGTLDLEVLWIDAKDQAHRAYVCRHYGKKTMLFVRPGWDV